MVHRSLGRVPEDITKRNEDRSRYEQHLLREKDEKATVHVPKKEEERAR